MEREDFAGLNFCDLDLKGNTFGENCQNVGLHQDAAGLRMGTVNFP